MTITMKHTVVDTAVEIENSVETAVDFVMQFPVPPFSSSSLRNLLLVYAQVLYSIQLLFFCQ
jgi:hypothetical protein